jgi:hypothetical protein
MSYENVCNNFINLSYGKWNFISMVINILACNKFQRGQYISTKILNLNHVVKQWLNNVSYFYLTPKCDQNYSFIQYNHYILITNTLISSLIPAIWVHPNKNFKIQQNKTVKTTYVPNTIRISTHGVDFSHKGSDFRGELKIANGVTARWVEEKEEREKERMKKEKGGESYSAAESRHGDWWDSCVSRVIHHGVIRSTSDRTGMSVAAQQSARLRHTKRTDVTQADVAPHRHQVTRLFYESRHVYWQELRQMWLIWVRC